MRQVAVEAYADKRRTHGGYAVILLRGVTDLPPHTRVRLRPGDGGVHDTLRRPSNADTFVPLTTRITADGAEIVIGPVGAHYAPAAPVRIEIDDAGIHGEFLWPCIVAPAPERRRRVIVARPLRAAPAPPPLAADASPGALPPPAAAGDSAMQPPPVPPRLPDEHRSAQAAMPVDATHPRPLPLPLPRHAAATVAERASLVADVRTPLPPAPGSAALAVESAAVHVPKRRFPRFLADRRAAVLDLESEPVSSYPVAGRLDRRWRRKVGAGLALGLTAIAGMLAVPLARHAERLGWSDGGGAPITTASIARLPVHCAAPVVEGEALDAGMMRLQVRSSCHAGQDVHIAYGGVDLVRRLDAVGTLDTEIDCFAGAKGDVAIRFGDGTARTLPVTARDLERVSKVALIWQAPVNLDLHAFEYGAQPGESGHRWNRAASSLDAARRAATRGGRGSGFISTAADGRSPGDQIEVYTFMHADGQTRGIVSFALDHAMDGAGLSQASCGDGALAEVGFRITMHSPSRKRLDDGGLIAPAECGESVANEHRYRSLAAWQLEVAR